MLVALEVNDSHEVPVAIEKMHGVVDAVWMLPDTTAVTSTTLEAYFSFSVTHMVPLVAFSEQYLSKGAAAAIDVDLMDMGRQAAEMVISLLKGNQAPGVDPRKTRVSTNDTLLRKLSKTIPKSE
jgi:putative ABC transport system substrate-binding protein